MTSKKPKSSGGKQPKSCKVLPVRTIQLQIRASDTGCFSWYADPERSCPYLATSGFGTRLHCGLFDLVTNHGPRHRKPENVDGEGMPLGAQRCEECLKAEVDARASAKAAALLVPGDQVTATRGWREGCKTIKKGKRGVVKLVIQSEEGVVYRVRWNQYLQTDVLDPTLLTRVTRRRNE